jgi:hypothetical protein
VINFCSTQYLILFLLYTPGIIELTGMHRILEHRVTESQQGLVIHAFISDLKINKLLQLLRRIELDYLNEGEKAA